MSASCQKDKFRMKSIHQAAEQGELSTIKALLSQGGEVNGFDALGDTPLIVAARKGHYNIVIELLKHSADVHSRTRGGHEINRPLEHLQEPIRSEALAYLERDRIFWKELKAEGFTALHQCTRGGYVSIAELLIDNGADVNATTDFGNTPLMEASCRNQIKMVRLLLAAGAEPSAVDRNGNSALALARGFGHQTIVTLLRKAGAR